MSDTFYCREVLKATDIRPKEFDFSALRIVSILQFQLAQLCAVMVCGRGKIESLEIIQDGVPFVFSGSLPTTELMEAVSRMTDAVDIEMRLCCSTSAGDVETSAIMEELDDVVDSEMAPWNSISFECLTADSPDLLEGRRLFRYGMWDGRLYNGEVLEDKK